MFVESFNLIRRIWADENFVHHGKYWTVVKNGPLSPPLVHRPHPPFLVSAQSEESQRWAAAHDIPFAQPQPHAACRRFLGNSRRRLPLVP